MKATAEKAKNGEWHGVVTQSGKELYRTATTSLDKDVAIKRAQNWKQEQENEPDPVRRKMNRDYANRRLKKIKETINVGDVVSTPKGAGVVKRISPYGLIEVKFSNNSQQAFLKDQVNLI